MHTNHVLLIGAVAVGCCLLGSQIRDHLPSWLSQGHIFGMRLDPSASTEIDDRRGQRGGGEIDTGDMGGPPPWGQGGGMPAWGQEGLGGPGGRGGGARCWDRVEHRDVPVEYCDREQGGRR